jgi:hypothetical protein
LEKIFKHTFAHKIWSVGYFQNELEEFLWLETKNEDYVGWYAISLISSLIQPIQSPEYPVSWITSIGKVGIFSRLKSGKNPGIQSIVAFDLSTGKRLYEIKCQFWYEIKQHFLFIEIDQQKYWMNMMNGQFTSEVPLFELNLAKTSFQQNPIHYEENQTYFKDFQDFFKQKFQENISKGIDYWEGKEKLIFSYYIYSQGWKNYLKICDFNFNVTHWELISEGELIGYNTFQIIENKIIYVTNKLQIVVYEY